MYCLYLRKSRADMDAEARGEGETLARHEKILLELARKSHYHITEIYREIVSGESIVARPEMQRLLQDVGNRKWDGVLVMEVERLARGDTIDQGIMAQTFKYSDTKIITPVKIYDPTNEFDEEYFEFGLFMSRREYKTINRRLQAGRLASIKEGKYVGSHAPYGYRRVRLESDKGWTLEPIQEEAEIVRLIFNLYTKGELQSDGSYRRFGTGLICRKLNEMEIPSQKGGVWTVSSVRDMLLNPVYIGKLRWNWRPQKKQIVDGTITIKRNRAPIDQYTITDGLHPPIISANTFELAQQFIATNPPRPLHEKGIIKNPLAGIIVCGRCGRCMVRRPASTHQHFDMLLCQEPTCDNIGVALHLVEERVLQGLKSWLDGYKLQWDKDITFQEKDALNAKITALRKKNRELDTLEKQLLKTHDLLEQEVYTVEMFLDRSRILSQKIQDIKSDIQILQKSIDDFKVQSENQKIMIPNIEKLFDVYQTLPNAQAKNDMLKEILEKAVYVKLVNGNCRGNRPDNFELTLYPRLPFSQTFEKK